MDDFIDNHAEEDSLDDDSMDEDVPTERRRRKPNGTPRKSKGGDDMADSSEEEDTEDEAMGLEEVRKGFIVDDEDEDDEEEDEEDDIPSERHRRKEKKRSRRREREISDDDIDEDDIDLIAENTGIDRRPDQRRLKRLKQGKEEQRPAEKDRGLADIFSDDDDLLDDDDDMDDRRRRHRDDGQDAVVMDEFADFIEEDEFSEDEVGREEGVEAARPRKKAFRDFTSAAVGGALADEDTVERMREIFGDGREYDFALQTAEDQEEQAQEQIVELKDVFEPSELQDRMLTDEDQAIKVVDEPERYQLARKPYLHVGISPEEYVEEGNWIASQMIQARRHALPESMRTPFFKAVKKVLDFLVQDNMEPPFVFHNRKDFLIHADRTRRSDEDRGLDSERLLDRADLWAIFDLDLKFRAFVDKRNALKKTYRSINVQDDVFDERIASLDNLEEIQDLQEYLQFQYAEELKDAAALAVTNGANGQIKKRPGATKSLWDRIRKSQVYNIVKGFGITAAQFALNAKLDQKREFADDPSEFPEELATMYLDKDFATDKEALKAAQMMLAEEMYMNPMLRRVLRDKIFAHGQLSVDVTEKGVKKIDELHPYYEFKYLRNQTPYQLMSKPELFLKILAAEEEKLVNVNIELVNRSRVENQLFELMTSENYSDQAEAWNEKRREVFDMAMEKLLKLVAKNFKEAVKTRCEDDLAKACRESFRVKLDQAPFQPRGLKLGETPRVFALSNGMGEYGKDAVVGIFMDEDGKVTELLKYPEMRDEQARREFVEKVNRRKPDVIGVGGFSVATNRLAEDLRRIVKDEQMTISDTMDGDDERALLEVIYVEDEVARLYMNNDRSSADFPSFPPLGRYCIAMARYIQNPLMEYVNMGKDVFSLQFDPNQQLVPEEKLKSYLEQAMVDVVNLVGVDINKAVKSKYESSALKFVCGLGPRKADHIMKIIDANGGKVRSRQSLLEDPDGEKMSIVGPTIYQNCASFLRVVPDNNEQDGDYLDLTRVHPQDYELGRKMAADALELDEEDIQQIIEANGGPDGVIRQIVEHDDLQKIDELALEGYADELEKTFNQKKRATLETIKAEIQNPYEELRESYRRLAQEVIFTKLTGETTESLRQGMVVPVSIRRVSDRYIACRLDCGVEGNVAAEEISDDIGVSPHSLFHVSQTVQAKIRNIDISRFYAELTLKDSETRKPFRKPHDQLPEEWDEAREEKDRMKLAVNRQEEHRAARVIKHPLFRPYNARQAEEYLAQHSRGDAVIRPSSKGPDHIAVTWKVGNGMYQHIDVLELDKENEFSVGRTLKVANKYSYSDLDDLIFNHVKAMARKVEEMEQHDKFKATSKEQVEQWLTTYTEANPKRSIYAFCVDPSRPGHFHLCFKAGLNAKCSSWRVRVVPQAFQLEENLYGDMTALCNGFKFLFTSKFQQPNYGHQQHRGPSRR